MQVRPAPAPTNQIKKKGNRCSTYSELGTILISAIFNFHTRLTKQAHHIFAFKKFCGEYRLCEYENDQIESLLKYINVLVGTYHH